MASGALSKINGSAEGSISARTERIARAREGSSSRITTKDVMGGILLRFGGRCQARDQETRLSRQPPFPLKVRGLRRAPTLRKGVSNDIPFSLSAPRFVLNGPSQYDRDQFACFKGESPC